MEDQVRNEYLQDCIEVFRTYKTMSEKAMERVGDEQFFECLDPESNSLALLVKHMAGNLKSRWTDLLTTDGEKPDRNRDGEFEIGAADSRLALMGAWENGWSCVFAALGSLSSADLNRKVLVRGQSLSLVQAINRQMAHAAYHAGQIVFLAKHFKSDGWESLSIPRGQSEQFNAAMAAKKSN